MEQGPAQRPPEPGAFEAFLESMPDAIVIIDRTGRIAFVNAHTEALFGCPRDELIGRPVEELLPERFRDAHAEHRTRYLVDPRTRPMGAGLELYGQRRDGTEFPVDISLSPLPTEEGLLVTAAIRDVTERKRLEAMRDEFIADAAHELRTPLATLATLGETLALHMDRMTREQLDEALAALKRQGERASRLVSNLLDLSQIESGRIAMALRTIEVLPAVRRVLDAAPAPDGVSLAVDVEDGLAVIADEIRLEQVITNLLTNAYRYGGQSVHLVAAAADGAVRVTVADDGPGVPPDLADRVFEPFTRGRTSGAVGGSGIGLAICSAIAEAFGGSIGYEPNTPCGARFVLTLRRAYG